MVDNNNSDLHCSASTEQELRNNNYTTAKYSGPISSNAISQGRVLCSTTAVSLASFILTGLASIT